MTEDSGETTPNPKFKACALTLAQLLQMKLFLARGREALKKRPGECWKAIFLMNQGYDFSGEELKMLDHLLSDLGWRKWKIYSVSGFKKPLSPYKYREKRTMMRINEENSDSGHDLGGGWGIVTFKGWRASPVPIAPGNQIFHWTVY